MANNPRHMENLKPFQKGNTIKGGRPKGTPNMTTILNKLLNQEIMHFDKDGKPTPVLLAEAIVKATIKPALEGQIAHIREIWDRSEGKPLQKSETASVIDYRPNYEGVPREILETIYKNNQISQEDEENE